MDVPSLSKSAAPRSIGLAVALCLVVAPIARASDALRLPTANGPAASAPSSHSGSPSVAAPRGLVRFCQLPGTIKGDVEADSDCVALPLGLSEPRRATLAAAPAHFAAPCATLRSLDVRWQV